MTDRKQPDKTRRNLVIATSVVGGAASVGAAVPFVAAWFPSERAKAAGAPVQADISKLQPGEMMVVEWRSKPVWIIRRTQSMLDGLKKIAGKLIDPASRVPQPTFSQSLLGTFQP